MSANDPQQRSLASAGQGSRSSWSILGRASSTLKDARNYLTNMIPYADDLVETVMSGLTSVIELQPNPRP